MGKNEDNVLMFSDIVDFIAERCDLNKDQIEKVLELEQDFFIEQEQDCCEDEEVEE